MVYYAQIINISHISNKLPLKLSVMVSTTAVKTFENYNWPGNVRDLENAIQSAMILAIDNVICLEDLPIRIQCYTKISHKKDIGERGL